MLLKSTIYTYLYIGVFLYVVLFLYGQNTFSYYNLVNLIVFIAYVMLLLWSKGRDESYYTSARLGKVVFLYSIIMVCLYLDLSFRYTDDSFFWDYTDPYYYFRMDERLLLLDIPFSEMTTYIQSMYGWELDDWGANLSQMLFLKLIPSRYFLFLMQTILGAVGAMMMFDICCKIMKKEYAYMASLSYSVASFTIYYYCSYRKECIMVFLVIFCFWLFYKYLPHKSKLYLMAAVFAPVLLLLFRPFVSILIWMGIFSYFVAQEWGKGRTLPVLFVSLIVAVFAVSFIASSADRYTNGGDITQTENYVGVTTFSIAVSSVGVAIGPFPRLLNQVAVIESQLPLYGSGLLLKLLMFLFFWRGFVDSVRNLTSSVLPLFTFCIMEMVALAVMNDGLELRKALPHLPIFYIATFWFMSKYDTQMEAAPEAKPPYIIPHVSTKNVYILTTCIVIMATFVWNTMK